MGDAAGAERQLVGVPTLFFLSRDNSIAHFTMPRDECQFCRACNFAVRADKDPDTFILIGIVLVGSSVAMYVKEEIVVIVWYIHDGKRQLGHRAGTHIRQEDFVIVGYLENIRTVA